MNSRGYIADIPVALWVGKNLEILQSVPFITFSVLKRGFSLSQRFIVLVIYPRALSNSFLCIKKMNDEYF